MTTDYRYRRFRDGDAASINGLYEEITGRRRTVSQFEWQWLKAPGGIAEIWLIEAMVANREPKLIGHHGIMPIRFTNGKDDLLFGKTENTMVLPDYRSRILYPRFEKRFAAEYEGRFDALFSTTGPPEAIRQRRALGYRFSATWTRARFPTSKAAIARLLFGAALHRVFGFRARAAEAGRVADNVIKVARAGTPRSLRALSDDEAAKDDFFAVFWPRYRSRYGLTPRRDREDLNWRFWSNPYSRHITLVSDGTADDMGYVIIKRSKTARRSVLIEDIVPGDPDESGFARLLESALSWMRENGIAWADFSTTTDSGVAANLAGAMSPRNIYNDRLLSRFRKDSIAQMPRKITANGRAAGLDTVGWYVTPMLSEGRSD